MGDIDCDFYGPQATVYMIRRHSPAGLNRAVVPVDAADCAPSLETARSPSGLAVVVVLTERGFIHQLQRDGARVCDVASWGALPVTAEMMEDAGLPGHAEAFRRWHDVDRDRPGDDITREAFGAMDRQS